MKIVALSTLNVKNNNAILNIVNSAFFNTCSSIKAAYNTIDGLFYELFFQHFDHAT